MREATVLNPLDCHQRKIVAVELRSCETFDGFNDGVVDFLRATRMEGARYVCEALRTEFFSFVIRRFGHTVRVEDEDIAPAKPLGPIGNGLREKFCFDDTYRQSSSFRELTPIGACDRIETHKNRKLMTGTGVSDFAPSSINHRIQDGDKHTIS